MRRPVISYAIETTTMSKREKEDLKIVERKIMRTKLCPDITTEEERRRKRNKEIEEKLGKNIVRYIKVL